MACNHDKQVWTKQEQDIIQQHYRTEGPIKCQSFMPNRTIDAIRRQANILRIHREKIVIWPRIEPERKIDVAFMGWRGPVQRTALRWAA